MLTNLTGLLATLIALSVAAERLASIVKNFSQFLSTEQKEADEEHKRQVRLQLLALVTGLTTAFLAEYYELLPEGLPRWPLLGLLASGGSGFWTSILGYVNSVKDIQKNIAIDTKAQATANLKALAYGEAPRPLVAPTITAQPAGAERRNAPARDEAQPLDEAIAKQADAKLKEVIAAGLARL